MRKFWQDLKRTLCLYLVVLAVSLPVCSVAYAVCGEEIANYTAIGMGVLGAIWIMYYEHKHDVWGRRKKCTKNQENPTPKDNTSSGS